MATINGTVGKNNYEFYAEITETLPQDYLTTNKSIVNYKIYLKNHGTRTNSGGWTFYAKYDNTEVYNTGSNSVVTNDVSADGGYKKLFEGSFEVTHNSGGDKSITFSASISKSSYTQWDPGYCSLSGPVVLTNIPRKANISGFNAYGTNETTVRVDWSTDAGVDVVQYSKNGANWVDGAYPNGGTSGSFNIGSLSEHEQISLKIRVRRQDSQQWSDETGYLYPQTYYYPHCTNSPNFTIGNALTLTLYNPLGRSVTVTGIGADGSTIFSGSTSGTSLTGFNDTNSVNSQYASIPNSNEGTYQVRVTYGSVTHTRNNGNKYYTNVSECSPLFSNFTYKDNNSSVVAVTGDDQVLVKGLSSLRATISSSNKMTTRRSATPSKYTLSCEALTESPNYSTSDINVDLGIVNTAGTQRLNVRAYDSRSNSALAYKDITVYDYATPVINLSLSRLNNFEAQTTVSINGTFTLLTIGNQNKNTINSVQYRYREKEGTWGSWTNVNFTLSDNTFTCNDIILSLDNSKAFEFEVKVTDRLTNNTVTGEVSIGEGIFFISSNGGTSYIETDFDVRGTLKINGVAVLEYDVVDTW